jgi:hypothetical protein
LAPSAFLATRTLIEITKTLESERAAYSIKNCFYVDNYLQSLAAQNEREEVVEEVISRLANTGCNLCKITMPDKDTKD